MQKSFILSFILFATAVLSFGQIFKGGVSAGIVGSQVAGDTYSGFNKAGIFAGGWISLKISERSSFQTEISYFQKGSRHNPDEKKQDFTYYLMRLGYIEMPFLLQYKIKNSLTLEAGPSFSFLLHSFEELDYVQIDYGEFSPVNVSFMAGIGYQISDKLSVHFRNNSSVISIRKDKKNLVDGAVNGIIDKGQYNDAVVLFLSYKL